MSEVTKPLVLNETFAEKLDQTNAMLAVIASKDYPTKVVDSWAQVQAIVRAGAAAQVFNIGDQLVCSKDVTTLLNKSNDNLSVTLDSSAFLAKMGTASGTSYVFTYSGSSWTYGGSAVALADYGLTVTGTPSDGDTITVTISGTSLTWDVIGIDHDTPSDKGKTHSLTLQAHGCTHSIAFDGSPEAMYYCESALSAGTYHFTIPNVETSYGGNATYQFTTTKGIPAGGQICYNWGYQKNATDGKIYTYESSSSTTALDSGLAVTAGSSGTDLGSMTYNTEIDESSAVMNDVYRVKYASNRWKTSGIRQWLNSDGGKGTYWQPQGRFDRPWGSAKTLDGFLSMLDPEFVAVLGAVDKFTDQHTVDGGGQDTTSDIMFFLSQVEAYCGNRRSGYSEGSAYPYYQLNSDLSAAGNDADTNRIKYLNGAAKWWWLRSPSTGGAHDVRGVGTGGTLGNYGADYSGGAAPACCII